MSPKFLYGSEILKRQSSVDEMKANYFYLKVNKTSAETSSLTFVALWNLRNNSSISWYNLIGVLANINEDETSNLNVKW